MEKAFKNNLACNHYLWADIAKGLAIILVIAGHSYPPAGKVCAAIYLFHMPLFFILSGYFFNFSKYENNFKLLLQTSAKRLLLPALVSTLIFYDFNLVSFKHLPMLLYAIGKPIPEWGIEPIGYAMWFLFCLFLTRILFWVFLKLAKRVKSNKIINIIAAFIIAYTGTKIGGIIKLPWSFDIALVTVYFAYIGYLMKQTDFLFKRTKWQIGLILIVSIILLAVDFKYFGLSMNERFYSNPLVSLNGAICGSIIVFYVSIFLSKLNSIKWVSILNSFFAYLGINTIVIMLVHCAAHSSISYFINTAFRLLMSVVYVEFLARIPFLKDVYQAKSIMRSFDRK